MFLQSVFFFCLFFQERDFWDKVIDVNQSIISIQIQIQKLYTSDVLHVHVDNFVSFQECVADTVMQQQSCDAA